MQDYSFDVPLFGGSISQGIRVNAIDVVHSSHCLVCRHQLSGAVVCIGAPVSALVHRQCLHNVDYARGWQHPYPAYYYRERSLAGMALEPNSNTQ